MKRRDILKTAGALGASVLAAPCVMRSASAAELELLTPGVLTCATEGTYPPFSMQGPDGKLDGLEMRIMGEICRRLELEYKPVIVKWESMLVGLQANHFDIVGNAMGITPKRQEAVTFCGRLAGNRCSGRGENRFHVPISRRDEGQGDRRDCGLDLHSGHRETGR